jgi:transmembrane sensor
MNKPVVNITNNDELLSLSRSNQETLEWFARLRDTPVKLKTQTAFALWCKENPTNRPAYDQIAAFWESELFTRAVLIDEGRLKRVIRNKYRYLSVMAVAATLLVGVWGALSSGWVERLKADNYTVVGKQLTMVFADGSSAVLDTDTAIAVDYSDQGRGVRLLSGRAFFRVRPDALRAFIVHTDNGNIRVVGTCFTVNTETTVPLDVQQGTVVYKSNNGKEFTVAAGKRLSTATGIPTLLPLEHPEDAFVWTEGRLVFRNRPLAEVIAEIDRYQPGTIFIGNRKLAATRVTGNYKLNDSVQIVESLAQATGASVSRLSDYLTILY